MFEIRKEGFFLDGKPFRLYSGTIHYFRVLPQYWRDRLEKLKAAGFNTVETVMCWNVHEPREGEFCFEGMYDVARYCRTAQELGLYVIIRPGPYICAEWDFGGFPAWLLRDKNLRVRCNDPVYMEKVRNYFRRAMAELVPLQITKGGNVIAMQIENEYGSYGNDKDYLEALKECMRGNGIDVPFFTSDGTCQDMLSGGTLPDVYTTLNFGSGAAGAFGCLSDRQPDMPKTCMEFWCGWFDHWGERHHTRNAASVAAEIEKMVQNDVNVNVYTFHGGTNFGFTAGANCFAKYLPTVTSYDDAALLNEYGDYTPAYHRVRKILLAAQGKDDAAPLPPRPVLRSIGEVRLTQSADLWKNLYVLGEKHHSATPESMEYFGQNAGYILYTTTVKGKYGPHYLRIEGAHDIVYVRINGKFVKKYDRTRGGIHCALRKRYNDGFQVPVPAFDGEMKIEILVDAMGRINYGAEMENDRKGIRKVRLGFQTLFGWDVYTLPMDNLSKTDFSLEPESGAAILRGTFEAKGEGDCFVDTAGFSKGFVVVNGFNLGRYWNKGPQRTLYLPAPLLGEHNEIVVVEQEKFRHPAIFIGDKHRL